MSRRRGLYVRFWLSDPPLHIKTKAVAYSSVYKSRFKDRNLSSSVIFSLPPALCQAHSLRLLLSALLPDLFKSENPEIPGEGLIRSAVSERLQWARIAG